MLPHCLSVIAISLSSLCGFPACQSSDSAQAALYKETADQHEFASTTVLSAEHFQNRSCSNMIFPSKEENFHNDTSLWLFFQEGREEKPRGCRSDTCNKQLLNIFYLCTRTDTKHNEERLTCAFA